MYESQYFHKVRPPKFPSTKVPTEGDIRQAVGFYEGEGSACRHRRRPVVSIAQKDRWYLEQLREWFGGSLSNPKKDSGVSYLHLTGELACNFLAAVYPHLSPRRQAQARAAWLDNPWREQESVAI